MLVRSRPGYAISIAMLAGVAALFLRACPTKALYPPADSSESINPSETQFGPDSDGSQSSDPPDLNPSVHPNHPPQPKDYRHDENWAGSLSIDYALALGEWIDSLPDDSTLVKELTLILRGDRRIARMISSKVLVHKPADDERVNRYMIGWTLSKIRRDLKETDVPEIGDLIDALGDLAVDGIQQPGDLRLDSMEAQAIATFTAVTLEQGHDEALAQAIYDTRDHDNVLNLLRELPPKAVDESIPLGNRLIDTFNETASAKVKTTAAMLLARRVNADPRIRDLLIGRYWEWDEALRSSASMSLHRLPGQDEEARRLALQIVLRENDDSIRQRGFAFLSRSDIAGDGDVIAGRARMSLASKEAGLRTNSILCLRKYGDSGDIKTLEAIAAGDSSAEVRKTAKSAISALEKAR